MTVHMVGMLAAGCVLGTFCMQSMVALRAFAIASNVLFVVYGAAADLLPIIVLHAILLPINGWSLGALVGGRATAITVSIATACSSCLLLAITLYSNFGLASGHAGGGVWQLP
jgi:hypothetical protein